MDAYLKSGELRSASNFYLNINFELLNGCKLHCSGCHVDKNAQNPISEQDREKFGHLLDDLSLNSYFPFIAFVGPTDFLSASNFVSIFTNSEMKVLLQKFKRISLQTTYLDMKNAEAVADVLKTHYADKEIEINLVLEPSRIKDSYYLKVLEKHKNHFLALLERSDVKSFGVMNVFNYESTTLPAFTSLYDYMHLRFSHLFETTIDYNFSFGRNPDMSNEDFHGLSFQMKKMFEGSSSADEDQSENKQYLQLSYGRLTDSLIERQYTYRNGKLYYSPLLYERFVAFRDQFEVKLDSFTTAEIEQFEMSIQLNQYANANNKEECENCPLLSSCIDRGILFLMDAFETRKCVVAKNATFAINTMGALPISGIKN